MRLLDFETGKAISVASEGRVGSGLTVAPDGKSIVYALAKPNESSIMLVKNFR